MVASARGAAAALLLGLMSPAMATELGQPPASAGTVLLVDGDASRGAPPGECPGDGSEGAPFRSLECAFGSGAIRAGTVLQLRDSAVPYAGASTVGHDLPSGNAGEPVTIEPAPGHAPILVGTLELSGLSGWTIRDLVFDGTGGGAPSSEAIRVAGSAQDVRIEGVTIRDWPGRGIVLRGNSGSPVDDAVVSGNRIEGAEDVALWIEDANAAQVSDNEIFDLGCTEVSFTLCDECGPGQCAPCGDCLGVPPEMCGATSDHSRGGQAGIRVLGDSSGVVLDRNYIHDFLDDSCGTESTRTAGIFITGQQARDGRISHNLIERIAPGNPDNGYGIIMFQSAPGWTIDRNVLTDVGHCGLCEGDDLFYGSRQATWSHNTVLDAAGFGIDVRWAAETELRGNLVARAQGDPIRVWAEGTAEPLTLDHNLYWSGADDGVVGRWGDDEPLDLGAWQGACACDAGSVAADPGLPSGSVFDPTPQYDGPAIDLVPPGESTDHHGEGYDAGALEQPRVLDARVLAEHVELDLDNQFARPLLGLGGCVGFSVVTDDGNWPLQSCSEDDGNIRLDLLDPAQGGVMVGLRYENGSVTDSAQIGGRLGARLRPFFISADNQAAFDDDGGVPPDPDGTTGSDGVDTGSDDWGDSGGFDRSPSGCGCRQSAPGGPVALLGLLLGLGLRRRRAACG